jgi:hypothetical protein
MCLLIGKITLLLIAILSKKLGKKRKLFMLKDTKKRKILILLHLKITIYVLKLHKKRISPIWTSLKNRQEILIETVIVGKEPQPRKKS